MNPDAKQFRAVGLSPALGCAIQGRVEPDEVCRLFEQDFARAGDRHACIHNTVTA